MYVMFIISFVINFFVSLNAVCLLLHYFMHLILRYESVCECLCTNLQLYIMYKYRNFTIYLRFLYKISKSKKKMKLFTFKCTYV